jgi:hypothetical protein
VRQSVAKQVGDVPICECVEKVRSLTATHDQSFGAQDTQTLRHGREFLGQRLHQFRHAAFAVRQQIKNPQACGVAQGPKQLRPSFDGRQRIGGSGSFRVNVLALSTGRSRIPDGSPLLPNFNT